MSSGRGAVANTNASPGCVPAPAETASCTVAETALVRVGVDEHEAAAAMLDELDARQRIVAAGAAAGDRPGPAVVLKTTFASVSVVVNTAVSAPAPPVEHIVAAAAGEDVGERHCR